jgi:hypothetical protein
MRRIAPMGTSLLLVGSAVLVVAGAWQRWAADCPLGGQWNSHACEMQQNHEHDAIVPSLPWEADHSSAVLIGLGYVLLPCALMLLPAAFAMRARPWQWAAVVVTASGMLVVGAVTALSGLHGRVVEVPAVGLALFVSAFGLPAALFLLMWRPHSDSPPLGPRRASVVWLLALTTPLLHLMLPARLFILYSSHDTAPWTEAAIAPLLLAAAVALKPWRAAPRRGGEGRPADGRDPTSEVAATGVVESA